MRKLEKPRDAGRPGAVKVKFEMCGDAGIVLRQEISHREIDEASQKSDACQNVAEAALQYL